MTPAQIAEQAAARKRAALANLQNAKHAARARADELYQERRNNKQASTLRTEERALVENHPFDLFPTPPDLADRMVRLALERHSAYIDPPWLEPSAGTGRIADAIRRAGGISPTCIELSYNAADLLSKRGYAVINRDFLECDVMSKVILMNPPFSNGQDINHVLHAFECLLLGGVIIAIMAEGTFYRNDKKATAFRSWLDKVGGQSKKLPAGTFKASGTMVAARIVEIDK